jgi:hypothetical protein
VVAEDVAGTNYHKDGGLIGDAGPVNIHHSGRMQKEKPSFEVIPN